MPGLLQTLSESVMPTVFSSLNSAGVVETMTVITETLTSDSAGARYKTTANTYTDVPVSFEPLEIEYRRTAGDKMISVQQYKLTFPIYTTAAVRRTINPATQRLSVNARGDEPAKVFRIIALRDVSGVVYEAICEKEN